MGNVSLLENVENARDFSLECHLAVGEQQEPTSEIVRTSKVRFWVSKSRRSRGREKIIAIPVRELNSTACKRRTKSEERARNRRKKKKKKQWPSGDGEKMGKW